MPLVFMFYLLCAITDCPPPVVHNSETNHNNNRLNLFNPFQPFRGSPSASASSSGDVRLTRSPTGASSENVEVGVPIVRTTLGDIQGRLVKSRGGRDIAVFEGIPYALPPVGDLRFRNPVPIPGWEGRLRVANRTRKDCLQLDFGRLLQVRGSEDCLYANVYTPGVRSKTLLPVIVFIHGGGWMSHSGSHYGPRYLLDKDVILVTFNFRLGVLGFLSTGDRSAFGNFGIKDQVVALKWIRDHIADFGGDAKRITLMGESSGAGSAALHILSPMTSKEVPIHGAIMLSGGSLNHWAIMNDTYANTKAIARRMNCPTDRSERLVSCLRVRDPYMLVGQQMHLWMIPVISRLLFGPVIESTENNPNPFLIEAPEVTYNNRRESIASVPVISGMNKNEGAMFAANVYLVPFLFNRINANWNKMTSYAMAYDRLPGVNVTETSEKVSKFYFNGEPWSFNNRNRISDALGDRTITTGVYKFLRQHSQIAPTYGYFFTYANKKSLLNQIGLRTSDWGVSHGDELPLLFSMEHDFDDIQNPDDVAMSKFMVNVCANFAHDRQPFPKNVAGRKVIWSPVINPNYMEVLEINTKRKMIPFPYMGRMKFWEDLKLN